MSAPDNSPSPPTQAFDALPGHVGRYRILERLGAGGMGTVYKAHDPQLDRVVAVKLPRFDGPTQGLEQRAQRFQREARAAAQVWHPHVCPIYDVGEHEGQPYVVMAYVEGRSLAERVAGGRYEDPTQAAILARQMLEALEAVHARGIIHRDLKPGNIMLDTSGRAILMDFGLARPEQDAEHLTSDGVVLGTPSYMAPEQAAGQAKHIGPWTDLYSLGVVLYQLLTGRLPFQGPPLTVLAKIVHEEPPRPSNLRPDLDPALEVILLKALAKECGERYQNAREFAVALEGWLPHAPAQTLLNRAVPPTGNPIAEPGPTALIASAYRPPTRERHRPRPFWGIDWLVVALVIAAVGTPLVVFSLAVTPRTVPLFMGAPDLCWITPLVLFGGMAGALWRIVRNRSDAPQALLDAAEQGQLERVKRLIRKGVDLEYRDDMGETSLMKAARKGYIGTVKLLIANGADVNAKNPFGETALSLAMRDGRAYITELLRQAGARE